MLKNYLEMREIGEKRIKKGTEQQAPHNFQEKKLRALRGNREGGEG